MKQESPNFKSLAIKWGRFKMQLGVDPKDIKIMMDHNTKRIVTLDELCPEWPR